MASAGSSLATEFNGFSRKQMQHYQKMFKHYDADRDKYINASDLEKMIKKMGVATIQQSDLEAMINEVDEDRDGKMSLREFLLIFHKALNGNLKHVGLIEIYRHMHFVDTEHEDEIPAISAFKAKIEEWSTTEEGTMI